MTRLFPSREGPFSYESSFWVDVRKNRERRATPARIKAALDGKVGHRKRGRGDERETWYIGQILHYGLGPAKITKVAARQRLAEATNVGKLKVPQPIVDIEKRLKEDYQKRSEREQRSRIEQRELTTNAASRTKGVDTGYSHEKIEDQWTEGLDDYMLNWDKEYEAEEQAKVKRRQEKYKAAKINGPLEPLEGTWNIEITDNMHKPWDPYTLIFRRDGTKLWGAFDFDQLNGILLVDPAPSKASNAPLPHFWRGREGGDGEITWLESDCTGEVVFLGGGKIIGLISDVEFTGTLDTKIKEPARTVKDMKQEWKGYNEKAHAREEISRWGGVWHEGYEDEEDEDDEGDSSPDLSMACVNLSYGGYPLPCA